MITGGLGFVGSHLAEEFSKNGHKITILTKSFDKISNLKNKFKLKKLMLQILKNLVILLIKTNLI